MPRASRVTGVTVAQEWSHDARELPARCVEVERSWSIQAQANWYDFSVSANGLPSWLRRFAGRLENGRAGLSDPGLAQR
jgi:hypothetical protein